MSNNQNYNRNYNASSSSPQQVQRSNEWPKKSNTSLPSKEQLSISEVPYVDSHTHLHYVLERLPDVFNVTSYEILKRDHFPSNFESCINVLCDPLSFTSNEIFPNTFMDWQVMAKTSFMYLAAGVHPHNAKDYNDYVENNMMSILKHPKCVALGEIGLDYHYKNSPKDIQKRVLIKQIDKAIELEKPIVIHTREAEEDTWEILSNHVPKEWKIHVHCFTDSPQFAKKLLDHFPNLYIGITGVVTFGSAKNTQNIIKCIVPLNRILLETDAPYMIPSKLNRNKKSNKVTICHSGMIPLVAEKIAQLKGIELDEVMRHARENTRNMYGV
ncbi:7121_t:CDS:1 [Funneliformis mosseae]|uniref:7121_t:CDS:1 n=1 Tax=Funneliformis mosseae TaxID=27381 RepID=A0A9N9GQG7_FUNMO|nr:7121_t:CDS:1 [Funneliformis mosseae]